MNSCATTDLQKASRATCARRPAPPPAWSGSRTYSSHLHPNNPHGHTKSETAKISVAARSGRPRAESVHYHVRMSCGFASTVLFISSSKHSTPDRSGRPSLSARCRRRRGHYAAPHCSLSLSSGFARLGTTRLRSCSAGRLHLITTS